MDESQILDQSQKRLRPTGLVRHPFASDCGDEAALLETWQRSEPDQQTPDGFYGSSPALGRSNELRQVVNRTALINAQLQDLLEIRPQFIQGRALRVGAPDAGHYAHKQLGLRVPLNISGNSAHWRFSLMTV